MFKTPAWDDGWPEAFHLARHLIYRCVHNGSLRRGNHKARFGRARGHAETRANARSRNQQATPLFGGARPSTIRGSFAFNQDVPVVRVSLQNQVSNRIGTDPRRCGLHVGQFADPSG